MSCVAHALSRWCGALNDDGGGSVVETVPPLQNQSVLKNLARWMRRRSALHPFWTSATFDDAIAVFRVGVDDVIIIYAATTTNPCGLVFNLAGIGSAFRVVLQV